MLRRPPSRTAASAPSPPAPGETKFVSQLVELEQTGEVRDERLPHDLNKPGARTIRIDVDPASDFVELNGIKVLKSDLPDFLFDEEPTPIEEVANPIGERWSEPFASGVALSDRLMKTGCPTPAPLDHLPHSVMQRAAGRRSVR